MRLCTLGILSLVTLSCRDIQPPTTPPIISGFQLNGVFSLASGVPIEGASVRLYLDYEDAGTGQTDTVQVVVTDSTKPVDVSVYTSKLFFVKTLFLGRRSPGPIPRYFWNGYDEHGVLQPSGRYLIGYQIGDSVYKFSPFLLNGQITATTNNLGEFIIHSENLPVDAIIDRYDPSGVYLATLHLLPSVEVDFEKGTERTDVFIVPLSRDRVTFASFSP